MNCLIVSGPISNPPIISGISETGTVCVDCGVSILSATITSTGSFNSTELILILDNIFFASGIIDSSTKELPISFPLAFKKVKAIPPPIKMESAI